MIKIKKRIILLAALFIGLLSLPVNAAQPEIVEQASISRWARYELLDGERSGSFNESWYDGDFLAPIPENRMDQLLDLTENKIKAENLVEVESFQAIEVGDNTSRGGFLKELYNMVARYETDDEIKKDPIMYMAHRNIVLGYGDDLHLDKNITTQEACIFATRLIDDFFNKHGLASKGLMWQAEKDGNIVYMLGSIHIADDSIYPFSNSIMDKFEDSETLYVEVDIADQRSEQVLIEKLDAMTRNMYYQDEKTLMDDLGEDLYLEVKALMDEHDIEEENYKKIKPWAVISQIQTLDILDQMTLEDPEEEIEEIELTDKEIDAINQELSQMEDPGDYGIDMYLILKAKARDIKVVELESLDFQYDLIFDSLFSNPYEEMSLEEQIKVLKIEINKLNDPNPENRPSLSDDFEMDEEGLLKILKENEKNLRAMLESWKIGDSEKLKEILILSQELEGDLGSNLLGERDVEMAKKISKLLESEEKKTSFVVVGAAHYVMDGTILDNLESMGYEITDLNRAN